MVERIRILLESRQLTPTQFADLIGVARPIISHVLSGRNKPSLEVVQRILAAMPDLSMAWLLNGTEPMLTAAREAASATPAPRPPEPAAAPLPVAPSQPVAPAQSHAPELPVYYNQEPANQLYTDSAVATGLAGAAVPTPVLPGSPSVAPITVSAGPGPAARPANPAPSRPPMPRRFPVRPPVAEQPVSAAAPEVGFAPVLPVPVASVVALPVAPIEVAAAATSTIESAVNKSTADILAAPGEPLVIAGASQAVEGALVMPSGVAADMLAPTSSAASPVAMPAPTPIPGTGPVSGAAPTLANDMAAALFTGAEKPIRRIVIFYRDGSFADYQPE